jgi:hypothetical protein
VPGEDLMRRLDPASTLGVMELPDGCAPLLGMILAAVAALVVAVAIL